MVISLNVAKTIYREAIDSGASDAEGAAWWEEVATEIRDVVEARTLSDAARQIVWWHNDWSSVGDTPTAAARRIRQAAREQRSAS